MQASVVPDRSRGGAREGIARLTKHFALPSVISNSVSLKLILPTKFVFSIDMYYIQICQVHRQLN